MAQRYVNGKFGDLETANTRSHIHVTPEIKWHPSSSFSSRFWVYYEVKRTVIKFWIC